MIVMDKTGSTDELNNHLHDVYYTESDRVVDWHAAGNVNHKESNGVRYLPNETKAEVRVNLMDRFFNAL